MSVSKDACDCKSEIESKLISESTPGVSIPLPHLRSNSSINDLSGQERSTWSRKLDFFLSCVGYAVGLGNIWRFPYLCYKSGGGAFLIPYILFLVVCGVPLFFLEMSLGQFGSVGPITIWKIAPLFKGLGYGMAIVSAVACIYYNVIIAWALYYIYQSYSVPWSSCENEWNTLTCISKNVNQSEVMNSSSEIIEYGKSSIKNATYTIDSIVSNTSEYNMRHLTASEEFWYFKVLHQSGGIDDIGKLQPHLVLSLILAWVLVFLCVIKGIKSSGKVVYVTATFPYLVLICLLIRGVTLPGAWNGIKFYLMPDFKLLLDFEVWGNAASQIFYSVGAGWGALLTMASYNKFSNNVYRDSILVPLINCGTSILAGFVVFSVIGFMAHETGKTVADVVQQGPGLAFVVYPQAIALLPASSFWAFLFFFMLLAVGLDTQFGMFETAVSALLDEYPEFLGKHKSTFIAFLCFILFILGLPCVTQAGPYIVQLMDYYCAAFSLMLITVFEAIVVAWIYGIDRFLLDISLMTKKLPSIWWKLCWRYITPFTILALLLFMIIQHKPVVYESYVYPSWSIALGWIIALCSVIPIPVVAIVRLLKTDGSLKERLMNNLRPMPQWGPALEENRIQYKKSLTLVPSVFRQSQRDMRMALDDITIMSEPMNKMLQPDVPLASEQPQGDLPVALYDATVAAED